MNLCLSRAGVLLLVSLAAACAGAAGSASSPAGGSAACSPEECGALPEPPIAPSACGAGHEAEIGTTCARSSAGSCQKTLTCGGKRPE